MKSWVVRAGRRDEVADLALEHDLAVIGWRELPDIYPTDSREQMAARLRDAYIDKLTSVAGWTSQIWKFLHEIEVGDLVVMPLKRSKTVHFGLRVAGDYTRRDDFSPDLRKAIPVHWQAQCERKELSPATIKQLNRQGTVYEITDATLVAELAAIGEPRGVAPVTITSGDGDSSTPVSFEDARQRIAASIVLRQGRRAFRESLITAYSGRCAITDCDAVDALEAAHIVPFRGPQTDAVENGLLLRADLHTLFDRELIDIDPKSLLVQLTPALMRTAYASLEGRPLRRPQGVEIGDVCKMLQARREQLSAAKRGVTPLSGRRR